VLLLALSVVTLPSQTKPRAQVKLAWDASPDTGVIGYVVRVGTKSGEYTQTFDVRRRRRFTYKNAVEGRRYFFVVSAYRERGMAGTPSEEVSAVAALPKPRRSRPRPVHPALNESPRSPSSPSDR
jgi:hypothetical protein